MNSITDIMTLRYAVRLAETASFRRAAEACRVTQPTISIQIRRLEESLGYLVFDRTSRGVRPTSAGEMFLARARDVLHAWDRLFASPGDGSRDQLHGILTLGVIPTLGPYLLPPLHVRLREEAPGLSLGFLEEQTSLLLHQLIRGTVDAAVVALPVDDESLVSHPLADDPFLVVTRRSRARERLRDRLDSATLPEEGLLLLADGHCFRGQALAVCGARSSGQVRVEGSSFATLLNMIEMDTAASYTLLPLTARGELAHRPALQALRFAAPAPSRRLGLVLRKSSPWLAAAPRLAGIVRLVIEELLRPKHK